MPTNAQLAHVAQRAAGVLHECESWHAAECSRMRRKFLEALATPPTYRNDGDIVAAWEWWRRGYDSGSQDRDMGEI